MAKFKVGDKVRRIGFSVNGIPTNSIVSVVEDWDGSNGCSLWVKNLEGVVDNWEAKNFELVEEKQEPCYGNRITLSTENMQEIMNNLITTINRPFGMNQVYNNQILKNGLIGELAGYTYEDYKPKQIKSIMSKITTFAKNLVLSADEKLLRKYGLHTECGEPTEEATDLVIAKLVKENEAYLIELAKGMEAEEAKK